MQARPLVVWSEEGVAITGRDEPVEYFGVRIGTRPQNVNVDSPDPAPGPDSSAAG
jgi:hypothetical protein